MCHMLPNYYLSVKFVCPGWRIPHLTLISSVEMNTEMQLYPRGKVKCFKPAMQFFHLPKSFSVISVKLSPYVFQKLKHVFVLLNNSCTHVCQSNTKQSRDETQFCNASFYSYSGWSLSEN